MTGFPDDKTYDGATTALQRELTALRLANDALVTECGACQTALREEEKEVERLREKYDRDISDKEIVHQAEVAELWEYAARFEKTAALNQRENVQLKLELATERAAREKAEADCAELRSRLSDAKFHRHQAERERDAALAQLSKADEATLELAVSRQAAETALASALADIERMKRTHGDRDEWVLAVQRADTARIAAESALASAQQELERRTAWSNEQMQKLGKQLADAEDKLAGCSESVEICHRQHEQCMKLLGRIQALLLDPNAQRTEWKIRNVQDLLREMISKGELPEGWDQ